MTKTALHNIYQALCKVMAIELKSEDWRERGIFADASEAASIVCGLLFEDC